MTTCQPLAATIQASRPRRVARTLLDLASALQQLRAFSTQSHASPHGRVPHQRCRVYFARNLLIQVQAELVASSTFRMVVARLTAADVTAAGDKTRDGLASRRRREQRHRH